jgi:hypothetical protein
MAGTYRKQAQSVRSTSTYSGFLPTVTPQNLFPIHDGGFALFLAGVGAIALVAFTERGLARGGLPEIAYMVAEFGRFVFPVLAYGAVLWLFFFGLRGV